MKRSHARIVALVSVLAAYGAVKSVWRGELPEALQSCTQPLLLAHRGFSVDHPENSIESVRTAVEMGFPGVEIDVHHYPDQGLVVRHDRRRSEAAAEPELLLKAMFESERGVRLVWWIDLKNLTSDNVAAVASEFDELVNEYSLAGRIFIESPNAAGLADLREQIKGPDFVYWHQVSRWNPLFDFSADLEQLLYGPFLFSVEQSAATKFTEALHGKRGIVTWTVNDPDMVTKVIDNGAVIVLTDRDFRAEHPKLFRPFDSLCPGARLD